MGNAVHKYLKSTENSSLAELYEKYHIVLIRIAKYYLQSYPAAEDVVSDVFTKMLEKDQSLNQINNLRNYLFTSVKRKCLDELKLSYNRNEALDFSDHQSIKIDFKDPETSYLNQELSNNIKVAIEKLPARCRTIFLMVKEDNLKYKEVAEVLNISQKTVEMHMGNALKALRKDLEHYSLPQKSKKTGSLMHFINLILTII
ncbi:MAG: RNA polymerase sigma-70 factor [Candidatus Cyclobacteriaceae bacterium M3_2C_046]